MTTSRSLPSLCAALSLVALACARPPSARADAPSMPAIAYDLWVARARAELLRRWAVPTTIPKEDLARLSATAVLALDEGGRAKSLDVVQPATGPHAGAFNASIVALASRLSEVPAAPAFALRQHPHRKLALRFAAPEAPPSSSKESP